MGLYGEIKNFGEYFNSLRLHENLVIIDLLLPSEWEDEKILRQKTLDDGENTVQMKVNRKEGKFKSISFYSLFDEVGTQNLVDQIKKVIKWNKDLEEKNVLLNSKILEMKKIFGENNIDSLRKLKIDFEDIKFEINGREELTPMASEGNPERPEGDRTT
jgi:hypothetical protein|tara:strand:- start:883 stop:1359 length:477 start_codon:yes stop_codon:yes gene_type:complete